MIEPKQPLHQLDSQKIIGYRNRYRSMMKWNVFLLFSSFLLLLCVIGAYYFRSNPKYFVSTTNGLVIPIYSLTEPVVTLPYIQKWSSSAMRSAFNLNFLNYEKQLAASSSYFTPEGWRAFRAALTSAGILTELSARKLYMSAFVNGTVRVIDRLIVKGQYTWRLQLPLLVTFVSASTKVNRQLYVALTVKRVPTLTLAKGIAITNLSAR